jgi:glycosyltransferase involved in cell wall biosynthesis
LKQPNKILYHFSHKNILAKIKLIRTATVPESLALLLKNQLRFLNQQFDVVAISSTGSFLVEVEKREGVRTVVLNMNREISLLKDFISFVKWIKLLRNEKPTILHAHTPKASLLSIVAARILGVPIRIVNFTGLRFETTVGFKRKLLMTLDKLSCWSATHVVAESEGVRQMLFENGITKKRIDIIGNGNINGIDETYWQKTDALQIASQIIQKQLNADDSFNFLFVGRIVRDKGIVELVEAFESLQNAKKNCKLILVGDFENSADSVPLTWREKINQNGNIAHVGFQADIRPWLLASQVLILPSYREGFPNVILQAGAMELPIIVSNVNGAAEVVNESNGILIEKKNTNALIDAMTCFIKKDKEEIKAMGQSAKETVHNKFLQKNLYPQILNYYELALKQNGITN